MLDLKRPGHPVLYQPFYLASGKLVKIWWIRALSPNLVTSTWGLLQLASGMALVCNRPLTSFLLACLAVLLDCLDGDLARAREKPSVSGTLLEQAVHWVGNMFIVAAAGIGVYRLTPTLGSVCLLGSLCVTHAVYLATVIRIENFAFSGGQPKIWRTALYSIVKFNYWLMPIELPLLFCLFAAGLNAPVLWSFATFFALSALAILVPQFFIYRAMDKKVWQEKNSSEFPSKAMRAGKETYDKIIVSTNYYLPEESHYPPHVAWMFPVRCVQPTPIQVAELQDKLRCIFKTTGTVYLTGCSLGDIAHELNLFSAEKGEVVIVGSGPEANRWQAIVERCGGQPHNLPVPFGKALDLNAIEREVKERKAASVVVQLSDSFDGRLNPIQEIGKLVANSKTTRLILDARLSLAVDELQMDEWGVDVTFSHSNSGLMSPPGINLIAINSRIDKAIHHTASRFFECQAAVELLQPHVLAALSVSTEMLLAEGIDKFLHHREEVALGFRKGVQDVLKYELVAESPSAAFTVFLVDSRAFAEAINLEMGNEYRLQIDAGETPHGHGLLRIGHAGWVFRDDIIGVIESLALSRIRIKHRNSREFAAN